MNLLTPLEHGLRKLDTYHLRRRQHTLASPCTPRVVIGERDMLAFGSSDYLGLAAHPSLIEALQQGATLYGAGSGTSHLVGGDMRAHAQLEERLAEFMSPHIETARALYFCSGYMANLAMLTALASLDPHDTDIFSDAANHVSLLDGARLSGARVQVYSHVDLEALETQLQASTASTRLVVTNSVFGMDGKLAPLPELLALCERYGAWLAIDDTHGFGVLGANGRGSLEHFNLRALNVIYMGTLNKAAGVAGAFVAAHATVIEWLMQRANSYIHTATAAPALAHALLTSIDLIAGEEGHLRRTRLQALIAQFRKALHLRRWQLLPSATAVQPIVTGFSEEAARAAAALYEQGLWVPAIQPPAVPPNTARLRVSLTAAHTAHEVELVTAAINALERLP